MIRLPAAVQTVIAQGGTVVVPSRQRAHAVRLGNASFELTAGRHAWRTPDVLPLDGWLRREVERQAERNPELPRLLTPVQEGWLWRECALEATRDLPLINRGALASSLQRAAAMAAEQGIDCSRWPQPPGSEGEVLLSVQRAVRARARAAHSATLPELLEQLGEALCPAGPLHFAGFLEPTPLLTSLTRTRPLEAGLPPVLAAARPPQGDPRVVLCQDEDGELEAIAAWCRGRAGSEDARLLVMLPGLPGRRERLASLIRQSLDPAGWLGGMGRELVVIEGGSPLPHVPAVAHALSSLALLSGRALDLAVLGEWLRAPFFSHPAAQRHALLPVWLADAGVLSLTLPALLAALKQAPPPLAGVARELARRLRAADTCLGDAPAAPRQWAEQLREALRVLGWPGMGLRDHGEEQTVARFEALLEETGSLAPLAGRLSRYEAVQWLTELAARTAYRPPDQDPLVTISPQLVDPVVELDGIWVAGLTADSFPQPVAPDPYLPLAAQRAHQVPAATAAGRLRQARAWLAAWRAASADLTLSAPQRAQDLELLPSPLLAAWPAGTTQTAPSLWLPLVQHREGQLESREDALGMPWPKGQPLPSGTRALDLQNQCPFRAYAELRLGAGALRIPQPGVAPELRGQLLHAALQRFWDEVRDSRALCALSDTALTALIQDCVATAAQPHEGGRDRSYDRAMARERLRTARLMEQLCLLERERAPFRVEATELDLALTLGERPLRVRVDRVDVLSSGGRAVLDYKSGRPTAPDWYGERPSHPQLLTYLAALGGDVVALATVNVNARELRFEGVAQAGDILPRVKAVALQPGQSPEGAWLAQRQAWVDRVNQLAAGFAAGQAQVDPRAGACEHCHLAGVCRLAERTAVSEAEEPVPESAAA